MQTASGRERASNLRSAMDALNAELDRRDAAIALAAQNQGRREQVGSGMRGDKRRTYRFRDDAVSDHLTGRAAKCGAVMRGNFDLLW